MPDPTDPAGVVAYEPGVAIPALCEGDLAPGERRQLFFGSAATVLQNSGALDPAWVLRDLAGTRWAGTHSLFALPATLAEFDAAAAA